ncbi:MAG: carbohydrate ABC transporter permease [Oscillospiraceae bacterium]|nr:carbohydrate ABC transporter permease [Oscillospiraceae bacterium]
MEKEKRGSILLEIVILLLSLLVVVPIGYIFLSSIKTPAQIHVPLAMPTEFFTGNFETVLRRVNLPRIYFNSVLVAVVSIFFLIALSSLASYSLARAKNKMFTVIYIIFLSGFMIPFQSGMLPLFTLIRSLGLMNKLGALNVVQIGTFLSFAILIYTGFIKSVPRELDQAALIDGCGLIRTFVFIIFPLLKPATVSVIVTTLVFIWNDFMNPLLFITTTNKMTLTIGMYSFMGEHRSDYGPIFALAIFAIIPPVILFLSLQRYFYKGMVAGSVKG